jgi:hypothetical protein
MVGVFLAIVADRFERIPDEARASGAAEELDRFFRRRSDPAVCRFETLLLRRDRIRTAELTSAWLSNKVVVLF